MTCLATSQSCHCCGPTFDAAMAYASCGAVTPQPLSDPTTLMQYAAQAGARSSDFTMCLALTFLIARRLVYWKNYPGDCGTPAQIQGNTGLTVGAGLGGAAGVDPEPISKGILSGLAIIGDLFGAAHARAVATEQATLCSASANFNQLFTTIEQAVKSGQISPDQAAAYLQQASGQIDSVLASIAKSCDAACGFRIGLRALVSFMSDIGFAALAPSNPLSGLLPTPPVASPGAPGTYSPPVNPLTGGNAGVGPTSNVPLPSLVTPGTILIIGGVAFIASRPGLAAA